MATTTQVTGHQMDQQKGKGPQPNPKQAPPTLRTIRRARPKNLQKVHRMMPGNRLTPTNWQLLVLKGMESLRKPSFRQLNQGLSTTKAKGIRMWAQAMHR